MFYHYNHLFLSLPRRMYCNIYQYLNYVQLRPKSNQYDVTTDALVLLSDYVATLAPDV